MRSVMTDGTQSDDVAGEPEDEAVEETAPRTTGPWDDTDEQPDGPYLDLGGLKVPAPPGLKMHMDTDKTGRVILVRVEVAGSELQLAPFAAPRTEGIWDEIRTEIAEQITSDGGKAEERSGPFGLELATSVMVRTPEGRSGKRTVRWIGADGPRWFLRGVITGPAATDPTAAEPVERLFAGCVVVRGTAAIPPRDMLEMRLPDQQVAEEPTEPSFDPLTRGPEITEIR